MRLIALSLMMISILSGCVASKSTPVSGGFLIPMTPGLMDQLRIQPNDGDDEIDGKLRLWGRWLCVSEGDCPERV